MSIKKIIAGTVAFSLVFGSVCYYNRNISDIGIISNAEESSDYTEGAYDSLTYKKYSDHIEISNCSVSATNVVIPDEIEGLPVTSIGISAFDNCSSLTDITVPESIINIGSNAFNNTEWYDNQPDGLVYAGRVAYKYKGEMPENTKIILKDDTKGIASIAFYGCSNLISITIPESVINIGGAAFCGCSGLTSIKIPDNVTSIKDNLFWNCSNLKEVIIPEIVTNIGIGAFCDCLNLTSIIIPESVNNIGDFAFSTCSSLTEITIPYSVTSIGNNAFYECSNLTSITILNPKCEIGKICNITNCNIYGYYYSTAYHYAMINDLNFIGLDSPTTTSTSTMTTTTSTTTAPITTTTQRYTATRVSYLATTTTKTTAKTTTRTTTTIPKAPTLLPKTMSIRANENKELTILNCSNPEKIQWISSNDEVAVVENGKVVGLSKGTATIYAVIGDLYGECSVNVGEEVVSEEESLKGDINGDNSVDSSDASIILAYYAYKSSGGKLSLEAFINME